MGKVSLMRFYYGIIGQIERCMAATLIFISGRGRLVHLFR